MENKKIRVGITSGDINGVGPEVILKVLSDQRIVQDLTLILYGSTKVFNFYQKGIEGVEVSYNQIKNPSQAVPGKVNLIYTWPGEITITPGKVTDEGGSFALKSLEAATEDALAGNIDVLVTAPLNKENIASQVKDFTGHTGWLAAKAGGAKPLMILMKDGLRVGLATEHIPISEVATAITPDLLRSKISSMQQSLRVDFGIRKPRIAVLGLNPHAGDNGLIGTEEAAIIAPVIQRARAEEDALISGPFPADGFFGSSAFQSFDGVLAMFHDQGLAPFKALSFGEGVNYTAGLPFVRTSPDHGTGYGIAGKGEASEISLRNAIYTGCDIFKSRELEKDIRKNPLKTNTLSKERG